MDSKHLQEVKVNALIVCSSCNVFESPPMNCRKQGRISWWPFSLPYEGKDKHQEGNNKKTCQAIIWKGLDGN
jgi:hypothetical protein